MNNPDQNDSVFFTCETSDLEPYICKECSYSTHLSTSFTFHLKKFHLKSTKVFNCLSRNYSCENCHLQTFSSLIWLKHSNCKKTKNISVIFNNNTSSFNHNSQNKSKVKWFYCDRCPYRSVRSRHVEQHIINRHLPADEIKWFLCEQCTYRAKTCEQLKRHKLFKHTQNESKHEELIKGQDQIFLKLSGTEVGKGRSPKWHHCDHCPYKSVRALHVKQHIISKHLPSHLIKWFKCEQCVYKTKSIEQLKKHTFIRHTPAESINWIPCPQCTYKAKRPSNLKVHLIRKHSAEIEWFVCDQCAYKAVNEAGLRRHFTTKHLSEGDVLLLQCEHCEYTAKTAAHLRHHVTSKHLPPECVHWFECDQCNRKFTRRDYLKSHKNRKHTSDDEARWFHCGHCLYRSKDPGSLRKHVKRLHEF